MPPSSRSYLSFFIRNGAYRRDVAGLRIEHHSHENARKVEGAAAVGLLTTEGFPMHLSVARDRPFERCGCVPRGRSSKEREQVRSAVPVYLADLSNCSSSKKMNIDLALVSVTFLHYSICLRGIVAMLLV